MLLLMYQVFSSLLGHLPFSVHLFLPFYGVTFFGTPNTIRGQRPALLDARIRNRNNNYNLKESTPWSM